jgi:hypothetical protein
MFFYYSQAEGSDRGRRGIAYNVMSYQPSQSHKVNIEKDEILVEITKIFSLCCKNLDVQNLVDEEKRYIIRFFWSALKKGVAPEVKHWCFYILSEFGQKLAMPQNHLVEMYIALLDVVTGDEEEDGKILLNISIERTIDILMESEN